MEGEIQKKEITEKENKTKNKRRKPKKNNNNKCKYVANFQADKINK